MADSHTALGKRMYLSDPWQHNVIMGRYDMYSTDDTYSASIHTYNDSTCAVLSVAQALLCVLHIHVFPSSHTDLKNANAQDNGGPYCGVGGWLSYKQWQNGMGRKILFPLKCQTLKPLCQPTLGLHNKTLEVNNLKLKDNYSPDSFRSFRS